MTDINKSLLNDLLKDLGKEYKKVGGKFTKAELIIVGGASIVLNYDFRGSTTDVDAFCYAASSLKDAASKVADKYGLPRDWLNSDFTNTASYSNKLSQYSRYYKTFSNCLEIRTINAEYLVAMKIASGRDYKNDLSDIIGIRDSHLECGNPLTFEKVQTAVMNLYGDWNYISEENREFLKNTFSDYSTVVYTDIQNMERANKENLIEFDRKYPNALTNDNVHEVTKKLEERIIEMQRKMATQTSERNKQKDHSR